MRLYKYIQKDIQQEDLQYQDLVELNISNEYPAKKSIIRNYLSAMDFYTPTDGDFACRYRILTKIINKYYNYELFTDNYEYFGNRMLWRLNKIMPTYKAKFNAMLAQNGYEDIWDDGLLWEHREGTRDTKRPEKDNDNHPVNFDRTDLADTTTTVGYNSDYPQVIVGSTTDYNATGDKTTTGRTGNDTVTHAMQENVGYGEDITRKFSPEEIAKAKLLMAQLIFNIDEDIVNAVADLFILVDYPFEDDFDVAIQMSILDDAKAYTNLKFNESKAYTDQEVAKAKEIVFIPYSGTYSEVLEVLNNNKLPIYVPDGTVVPFYYYYQEQDLDGKFVFTNGLNWAKVDEYSYWTFGSLLPPQDVEVLYTSNTSYTLVNVGVLLANNKLLFVNDDAGISGDYHRIFAYQSLNSSEVIFSSVYQDSGTHYMCELKFDFNNIDWTYAYYELQEKLIGLNGYVGQNIKEVNGETILGTGSIDTTELFECTYGTTTYAEITQALSEGKFPYVKYGTTIYYYSAVASTYCYFSSQNGITNNRVMINTSTNSWTTSNVYLENISNKVTSISASSTDTQYPSAKCVYDAILNSNTELYVCTYGTTTHTEVEQALSDGKLPICIYNYGGSDGLYILHTASVPFVFETRIGSNTTYTLILRVDDSWSRYGTTYQDTNYRVTSISSASTNTQYPSAKCVYDAIQGAVGSGVTSYLLDMSTYAYSSGKYTVTGIDLTGKTKVTLQCSALENPSNFHTENPYIDDVTASSFAIVSGNSISSNHLILTVYS